MMVNEIFNIEIQRIFITLSLDDITGSYIIRKPNLKEMAPNERWAEQYFVANFIYKNLASGLIKRVSFEQMFLPEASDEILAEKFLITPFDNESNLSLILWNAVHFTGTEHLIEILKRHNLFNWESMEKDFNRDFMLDILSVHKSFGLNDGI